MRRGLIVAGAGLVGTALVAAAAVCLGSGCSTLAYYGQAVHGHLDLIGRARPVAEVLAEPDTPAALRERLQLTQALRDFAVTELALPDNRSYRRYADLQRDAAVWNVVATPELSLTLQTWCFAVMGCVGYRGYYDRAGADALAAGLRAQGLEVQVYGVPAYSTLGWTDWLGGDPLLNTFIRWPEGDLARLLFHELAHQVAYAADDTTFNESYATAVERLGGQRWLAERPAARAEAERAEARRADWLLHLPPPLSERQAMAIGTAGYTAMLCVMALQRHGLSPGDGDVLVTGASGGVGTVAISLLAGLGYRVVASTGRLTEAGFLQGLGAAEVISREEFSHPGKPLAKERFAGVVDAVGSHTLANACAATRYGGAVAACGLAQGMDFPGSVAPFILRGVTLYGIDSVMAPLQRRQQAWARLAAGMDLARLDALTQQVGLSGAIEAAPRILAGQVRGRLVVDVDG